MIVTSGVRIYSTEWCPYCVKAKNLLKKLNIPFEEIDLTNDDDLRQQVSDKSKMKTVPIIYIGETLVGGCDDLYALHNSGKLQGMIHV